MKKQWLMCAMVLLQLTVTAQTEKGCKLISVSIGTLGYNYQEDKTYLNGRSNTGPPDMTNSFNISLSPSIAWFLSNNFALGAFLGASYVYNNTNYTNAKVKESTLNITLGPQARGYLTSGAKGKPFIDVGMGIGFLTGSATQHAGYYGDASYTVKSLGNFSASLGLGYEHFITKNVGFFGELGIGYSSMSIDYENDNYSGDSQTRKQKKLSFPIMVGLQVHLSPKEKKQAE